MENKSCLCCNNNLEFSFEKDELFKKYDFFKCEKCGFVRVLSYPSTDELSEYYNKQYGVQLWQKNKVIKKINYIIPLLKKYLPEGNKVVEIGCSYGYALNELKKNNYQVKGIELSKETAEFAKNEFDIEIIQANFDNFVLEGETQAVFLLDVMEHLTDLDKLMENLKKNLSSNGLLVLTLPNVDSTEFKMLGKDWAWVTPPAHLNYFGHESIKKFLGRYNFEMVHYETFQGDLTGNILFHIWYALEKRIFYSLKHIIGQERIIKYKNKVAKNLKKAEEENEQELDGLNNFVYKFTELFNFILKPWNKKRYKKLKGPTVFLIAKLS